MFAGDRKREEALEALLARTVSWLSCSPPKEGSSRSRFKTLHVVVVRRALEARGYWLAARDGGLFACAP